MGNLAIICGKGSLPVALAEARPDAVLISLAGVAHDLGNVTVSHRFERLGELFNDLKKRDVSEVIFAGAMQRPKLNPADLDAYMLATAPRLMAAFGKGDDTLLRLVIDLFEEEGLAVRGAHEILPELTAKAGLIAGPEPDQSMLSDAEKAHDILHALAPLDVGQAVAVAGGLCLGIETLQGTDALLGFVQTTPASLKRDKGCLVKAPKAGQDLRVDMPTIGLETIEKIAAAGLGGVFIAPGKVIILNHSETLAKATELSVTIFGDERLS